MAKVRRAKRKLQAVAVEMAMEELLSSSVDQINASTTRTSADGRRIYHHTVTVPPPSPKKRQRRDYHAANEGQGIWEEGHPSSDGLGCLMDESLWQHAEDPIAAPTVKPAARRYVSSVRRTHLNWPSLTLLT